MVDRDITLEDAIDVLVHVTSYAAWRTIRHQGEREAGQKSCQLSNGVSKESKLEIMTGDILSMNYFVRFANPLKTKRMLNLRFPFAQIRK